MVEALTGTLTDDPFPFVGVSEDGTGLIVSFNRDASDSGDREIYCPPDAQPLLNKLERFVRQLVTDGVAAESMIIDINPLGELLVFSRDDRVEKARVRRRDFSDANEPRLPVELRPRKEEPPEVELEVLECALKHGICLRAETKGNRLGVREVAEFLNMAMEYFRHRRQASKTASRAKRPYRKTITKGDRWLGELELSASKLVAFDLWIEAIIDAYTQVGTLEQMLGDLPAWQHAVEEEGSRFREIVQLVGQPGKQLKAVDAILKTRQSG